MIPTTEHLPCSADLSTIDLEAERMRSRTVSKRRLDPVPPEESHRFTEETWNAFQRQRYWTWHSEGWVMKPEDFLGS